QVYPSGPAAWGAGGSGAAGAPSSQLLMVECFPPRAQMLQVTDPAASRVVAVGLGYSPPVQKAIRSANSTVLLVPSAIRASDLSPLTGWPFKICAEAT